MVKKTRYSETEKEYYCVFCNRGHLKTSEIGDLHKAFKLPKEIIGVLERAIGIDMVSREEVEKDFIPKWQLKQLLK